MIKTTSILAAACVAASLGVLGVSMTGAQTMPANRGVDNMTGNTMRDKVAADSIPALPAGITSKDLNSDKSIEKAFKAVTEDAMSKTGFDNIVGKLVDQDRTRIEKSLGSGRGLGNVKGDKNKEFSDLVAQITDTWKAKYNQKFDIDIAKVFGNRDFITIQTGEVTDANQLVGKWPVDAGLMDNAMEGAGKLSQADADQTKHKVFGGDVNLEKGRNVAIAHIYTNADFHGLNASLIHEAGGWKFDVPNTLTADGLYDNVVKNLTTLAQDKDKWPADVNDGYRLFTRVITSSMYDVTLKREPGVASAMPTK